MRAKKSSKKVSKFYASLPPAEKKALTRFAKGWYRDNARHSLARRGIKTKQEIKPIKAFWKGNPKPTIFKNFESEEERKKTLSNLKKQGWAVSKPRKEITIEDTMTVAELLPEYEGDEIGELTLTELKDTYPPLYNQIKHWEELGEGFSKVKDKLPPFYGKKKEIIDWLQFMKKTYKKKYPNLSASSWADEVRHLGCSMSKKQLTEFYLTE